MQTMKITLLVFVCLALLGACGLKGKLYLPEEESAAEQGSTPDTDAEKEKEKGAANESVSG
jgi:predicted small lipoprotein YifL